MNSVSDMVKSSKLPFFSIIMPVYNATAYFQDAVKSILSQSYENFELLIVDDCSTDDSYNLCLKVADADKRVKVFKTSKNGGPAVARNFALRFCRGAYITFVDSDDYVDDKLLEIAAHSLKSRVIDCLKMGVIEEYIDGKGKIQLVKRVSMKDAVYVGKESIFKEIVRMDSMVLFGYPCNGFYKREIVETNNINFNEELMFNEDFHFNIDYFKHISTLKCLSYCGYHYEKRLGGNSLSMGRISNYYEISILRINAFLQFLPNQYIISNETNELIYWMYVRLVYSSLERKLNEKANLNEFLKSIEKSQLYLNFKEVKFTNMGFKQNIMIWILRSAPHIFLLDMIQLIGFIKHRCPCLFAKVKN